MAGREYLTSIVLGAKLASTFKAVTSGATDAIKSLQQQAAKLNTLDRSTESLARLNTEALSAQRRFNTAASVLDRMRAEAQATGVVTEKLAKEIAAAEKATAREEKAFKKASGAARDADLALRVAGVDTSRLAAEQHRLGAELAATTRKEERLVAAQAAHKRLFGDRGLGERLFGDPKEARIDKLGRQLGGLVSTAAKVAAVGVGAGVGLFALVKRAADTGDAVDDASKRLHIGAAALQAFQFQGKLAGAEAEDVNTGIGKLAINIGKVLAAKKKGGGGGFGTVEGLTIFGKDGGGGSAAKQDPFKHIGLNVKQLAAQKPEQQIEAIADAISKLPTQAERSAAAVATLGKGGLKLLPILEKGGAALRAFREEGVRTGKFMSDEATGAASDFNDALEELTTNGVNSLVNALGGTLLPVGTRTMKDLTRWIGENQDKIRAWAETAKVWIETKAIPAIKSAATEFMSVGGTVVSVVQRVADLTGGFGNLVIGIAALKAAPLIATSGEIVLALGKMALAVTGYGNAAEAAAVKQKALALGVGGAALAAAAAVGYSFYNVYKTGQEGIDNLEAIKNESNKRYLEQMDEPVGPTTGRRITRGPATTAQLGEGTTFAPGAIQVTVTGGDLGSPEARQKNAEDLGKRFAREMDKHERHRRRVKFRESPANG